MQNTELANAESIAAELAAFFREGEGTPTAQQWRALIEAPDSGAIGVVNFIKFRHEAIYEAGAAEKPCSGAEAFMRYGARSAPRIAAVGGTMTFAGRFERTIIGADEDWDAVIVANYPNRKSFLQLFQDSEYRDAFRHRRAAVARYRAIVGAAR
jgi:uncharacterized protein (DUF1330 family)